MAAYRALTIQDGVWKQLQNTSALIAGNEVQSASGQDLTLTPSNTNLFLAAGKTFKNAGGAAALDFSDGSGIFKTTTGTVTLGPGTVTVSGASSFTAAGTAIAVTNNGTVGGTWSVTGAVKTDGGVGRITGGALGLGSDGVTTSVTLGNNAAVGSITIGISAMTTTVAGHLTVTGDLAVGGNETVTGTTDFTDAVTFKGPVTMGDGAGTDTMAFNATSGRLGTAALPDVKWIKEVDHQFYVDGSTTAATAGGKLTVSAGAGAAGGADGGELVLRGGSGTSTNAGGKATLKSGDASSGTSGTTVITTGTSGGDTGNIEIDVGSASGTPGKIYIGRPAIGTAYTLTTRIGHASHSTEVTGGFSVTGTVNNTSLSTTTGTIGISSTLAAVTITSGTGSVYSTIAGSITANGFAGVAIKENGSTLIAAGIVTGSVAVTASAASSFTTSVGAVTITAAATSTWSTSSGDLNITAAGQLKLDGTSSGIGLKAGGTELMSIASGSIQIKNTGTVFSAAAGTAINLEVSGSRLQIAGVAISGTGVTAANFDKHFDGSLVTTHYHAASASSQVEISGLTTTGLADGDLGYISADSTVTKAIATSMAAAMVIGANEGTSGSMTVAGVVENQNVDTGISIAAGERLYLSKSTAGAVTNVAPSASGDVVAAVGIAKAANASPGADVTMIIQILPPVQIP